MMSPQQIVESCVHAMQVTSNVALTIKTDISRGEVMSVIPGGDS